MIGTLSHATCDVYSPKAVETLWILFSLLCIKYMFFLFYRSVGFEENIKYANNSWNALICSFHFHSVTSKIMLTLQNYFWQKRKSLFGILRVFLVVLGKRSELFGCLIEASSEILRKN